MGSANVDVLQRIYDGWGRGDFGVGEAEFAPDATMVIDPEIPDGGVYEGLEGIRHYTRHFLSAWDNLRIVPKSFREVGDNVVFVPVVQNGVGTGSGIPAELHYFHLWTLRDGKVTELQSILREGRALEMAGLPPAD